jgi:hypothetical protein
MTAPRKLFTALKQIPVLHDGVDMNRYRPGFTAPPAVPQFRALWFAEAQSVLGDKVASGQMVQIRLVRASIDAFLGDREGPTSRGARRRLQTTAELAGPTPGGNRPITGGAGRG